MSTIACHPNEVSVAFWKFLVPPALDANKALIMFLSYICKNDKIIKQCVNNFHVYVYLVCWTNQPENMIWWVKWMIKPWLYFMLASIDIIPICTKTTMTSLKGSVQWKNDLGLYCSSVLVMNIGMCDLVILCLVYPLQEF